MTSILAEANEKLDRYYELKCKDYTIEKVEKRVMEIFGVEKDVIYSKLAKRLGMTQPAVSYAVIRGEQMAKERNYNLVS